jgi:two-component system response regulator LytT
MRIVIIEDEKLTADDLAETILGVCPDASILAVLGSVRESISWFGENTAPDLVFSDIQLGDGISFEIFKSITQRMPVIFCTAYDEYALHAFKANGIDYVLKPFSRATITTALEKYRELKGAFSAEGMSYKELLPLFENRQSPVQGAVLVYQKDKILPVRISDIALIYLEHEVTHLITADRKTYSVNKTLEEMEMLCGSGFYRANRQFLVNRTAVKEASQYFSRKLSLTLHVPFGETITISKEKTAEFLSWLSRG